MFMLAVALLVSAISFTRVGAGEIKESNATATVSPSTKFLDIATPEKFQPFVMNGSSANSYFAQFTYYPATYKTILVLSAEYIPVFQASIRAIRRLLWSHRLLAM